MACREQHDPEQEVEEVSVHLQSGPEQVVQTEVVTAAA